MAGSVQGLSASGTAVSWAKPSRGVGPVLACEFPFGFRPLVAGVAQPTKRLPPNMTRVVGAASIDRSNESAAWAAVCAEVLLRSGHTVYSTRRWRDTVYSRGSPAAVRFLGVADGALGPDSR